MGYKMDAYIIGTIPVDNVWVFERFRFFLVIKTSNIFYVVLRFISTSILDYIF